ncbi:hypothetical protein [Aequorivita vladivostokensis]|uniref:Lipoprotein n=1 Tax=Aequorivita vladivostokensis TaxID=171194 RepID=A0ABR5DM48_9FLAO|nr:hypothetical protein [Aequorivita vladivostokensis]KJJ39840.1 hypothetical protein MB09_01320 [Aequorivita vladivostokensis]
MKATIIILALILMAPASCSKKGDDGFKPTLPPITQTGENTFGCYANGVLITPRDGSGTFNSPDYGLRFVAGPSPENIIYNEILVHDFASEKTASITVHIIDMDSLGIGEYIVNESNCYGNVDSPNTNNVFCRIWVEEENLYKSYCSLPNSGVITITRYDDCIISGTFSCRAAAFEEPTASRTIGRRTCFHL